MSKKVATALSSSAAVLDASALQDHLVRSLRVDLSEPRRPQAPVQSSVSAGHRDAPKVHGTAVMPTPATARSSSSRELTASRPAAGDSKVGARPLERKPGEPARLATRAHAAVKVPAAAKPITALHSTGALASRLASRWTCDACDHLNTATTRECGSCGAGKAADIVAVAPALSLAQKRGLVPAPAALLTPAQWAAIEARAQARLIAGGKGKCADGGAAAVEEAVEMEDEAAAALPEHANAAGGDAAARASFACPICFESFGLREQVLLSCSHTFHRCCLDSFEAYQRREIAARGTATADGSASIASQLQCPVCRCAGYQVKRTRVAARLHVLRCIVAIQAVWRGRVTRKAFWELRKAFWLGVSGSAGTSGGSGAPATASLADDTGRRRAFAREMLSRLQARLAGAQAQRSDAVSAVLASADKEVAASRDVLAAADARIAERLRQRAQLRASLLAGPTPSISLSSAATGSGGTTAATLSAPLLASAGASASASASASAALALASANDIFERAVGRELELGLGRGRGGTNPESAPASAARATPASAATRWWQQSAGSDSSGAAASASAGASAGGARPAGGARGPGRVGAVVSSSSVSASASLEWSSIREAALSRILNDMREALTRKAKVKAAKESRGAHTSVVTARGGHADADEDTDEDEEEEAACEACPICIMPLLDAHVAEALLACGGKGAGGSTAAVAALSAPARASCSNISVLSCSHALHTRCAASLERFVSTGTSYEPAFGPSAAGAGSSATQAVTTPQAGAKCPTCRAPYSRTSLC